MNDSDDLRARAGGLRARAGHELWEYSRLGSARLTKQVALWKGAQLGMVLGCGFPKSGTVWLCQLLGTTLGLPYPREYRSPIAMPAVLHTHWSYDARMPPAAYIRRDGRDVMVSLYFHAVRSARSPVETRRSRTYRKLLTGLYGSAVDTENVRDNLPRFVESQLLGTSGAEGMSWRRHVADWWGRPGVAHVAYEDLLQNPVGELCRVTEELNAPASPQVATLAVERWAMRTNVGRAPGEEDRGSFVRKGVAGDWRNHFTREAGQVFDALAGDLLVELGYERDRRWFESL